MIKNLGQCCAIAQSFFYLFSCNAIMPALHWKCLVIEQIACTLKYNALNCGRPPVNSKCKTNILLWAALRSFQINAICYFAPQSIILDWTKECLLATMSAKPWEGYLLCNILHPWWSKVFLCTIAAVWGHIMQTSCLTPMQWIGWRQILVKK